MPALQDLTTDSRNELLGLRDAQFALSPTQAIDNTTLLAIEVARVRALDVTHTPLDSNTLLEANWDGVR